MAKEKADSKKKIPQITFRCSAETKESIEDLARIGRYENVSALLNEICEEYIAANKQRIINFRRTAKPINKPASVIATPSKPKTPKKPVAQMSDEQVTSDGGGDLKVGDGNAENS
ncbi:MAG: hypothetical protein J5497_06285 [Selenomonadaceae bacterium]|nr:hypothetical protein [Selenomonadaceae bacterium]